MGEAGTPLRVGVVGLGLIGGSLLRGLARDDELRVAGFDVDAGVRAAAEREGYAVAGTENELVRASDVVAVAVPPRATGDAVARALAAGAPAVFDLASVKAPVIDAARSAAAPGDVARFVPAHPLAGARSGGWAAGRADLLDGASWAVCPAAPDAARDPFLAVCRVLDALDARLAVCAAGDHDAAVARSSHVPHVLAQALARLADHPLAGTLAGGALRDGTRVAGADAALWTEILALNRHATIGALDDLERVLAELRDAIADGGGERLRGTWSEGCDARRRLEVAWDGERAWTPHTLPWPAWDALVELGTAGRLVRRVRAAGAGVAFEVG